MGRLGCRGRRARLGVTTQEGKEYPLVKLEISRSSHPYYTGKAKLVDTAGRVDKFRTKYAKFKK